MAEAVRSRVSWDSGFRGLLFSSSDASSTCERERERGPIVHGKVCYVGEYSAWPQQGLGFRVWGEGRGFPADYIYIYVII